MNESPNSLFAEELHQLLFVAASLQFVEERSEQLVIDFYPFDAQKYPTAIDWIKTANNLGRSRGAPIDAPSPPRMA